MRMGRATMRKIAGRTEKWTTRGFGSKMRPACKATINRKLERKVRQQARTEIREQAG